MTKGGARPITASMSSICSCFHRLSLCRGNLVWWAVMLVHAGRMCNAGSASLQAVSTVQRGKIEYACFCYDVTPGRVSGFVPALHVRPAAAAAAAGATSGRTSKWHPCGASCAAHSTETRLLSTFACSTHDPSTLLPHSPSQPELYTCLLLPQHPQPRLHFHIPCHARRPAPPLPHIVCATAPEHAWVGSQAEGIVSIFYFDADAPPPCQQHLGVYSPAAAAGVQGGQSEGLSSLAHLLPYLLGSSGAAFIRGCEALHTGTPAHPHMLRAFSHPTPRSFSPSNPPPHPGSSVLAVKALPAPASMSASRSVNTRLQSLLREYALCAL